jgi:hypothetical protein
MRLADSDELSDNESGWLDEYEDDEDVYNYL